MSERETIRVTGPSEGAPVRISVTLSHTFELSVFDWVMIAMCVLIVVCAPTVNERLRPIIESTHKSEVP